MFADAQLSPRSVYLLFLSNLELRVTMHVIRQGQTMSRANMLDYDHRSNELDLLGLSFVMHVGALLETF